MYLRVPRAEDQGEVPHEVIQVPCEHQLPEANATNREKLQTSENLLPEQLGRMGSPAQACSSFLTGVSALRGIGEGESNNPPFLLEPHSVNFNSFE